MRALIYRHYTDASGLTLADVPLPEPTAGRVLLRVEAASLNPFDWHMYRGEPWFMRLQEGWRVTTPRIVGADVAGVIEAVGADVDDLAVGDRVFGSIGLGAVAEYAAPKAAALAKLPGGVGFEAGAASAMAGLTALQALRDSGALTPGERVLVWGASGGVGHLAVQLARILGAGRVDAVCSGRNATLARESGAEQVFDYTAGEGPTERYDLVIDTVCTAPVSQLRRVLTPAGRVVTVGSAAEGGRLLGPALPLVRRIISARAQRVEARGVLAAVRRSDLDLLADRLTEGTLAPRIPQIYPLEQVHEAIAALEGGHVAGKLVVRI